MSKYLFETVYFSIHLLGVLVLQFFLIFSKAACSWCCFFCLQSFLYSLLWIVSAFPILPCFFPLSVPYIHCQTTFSLDIYLFNWFPCYYSVFIFVHLRSTLLFFCPTSDNFCCMCFWNFCLISLSWSPIASTGSSHCCSNALTQTYPGPG